MTLCLVCGWQSFQCLWNNVLPDFLVSTFHVLLSVFRLNSVVHFVGSISLVWLPLWSSSTLLTLINSTGDTASYQLSRRELIEQSWQIKVLGISSSSRHPSSSSSAIYDSKYWTMSNPQLTHNHLISRQTLHSPVPYHL